MLTLKDCLIESKTNAETTRLSRICFLHLIDFIKNPPVSYKPNKIFSVELPVQYKNIEVGTLEFQLVFVTDDNPNKFSNVSGEYINTFDKGHLIIVTLAMQESILTSGDYKKILPNQLVRLKGVIQHELEHMLQTINGRDDNLKSKLTNFQYYENKELDEWMYYWLRNDEIETHVVELMRKAKMVKIPLTAAIKKSVDNRTSYFKNKVDDETLSVAKETIIDTWTAYAKKRFPKMF